MTTTTNALRPGKFYLLDLATGDNCLPSYTHTRGLPMTTHDTATTIKNDARALIRQLANCDSRGLPDPLPAMIFKARIMCGWTKKEAAK